MKPAEADELEGLLDESCETGTSVFSEGGNGGRENDFEGVVAGGEGDASEADQRVCVVDPPSGFVD